MTANPKSPLFFAPVDGAGALPPVENWHPAHCGDSQIRIAADGAWFHQGAPIRRPELVRLFAGLLRRDPDGFVLVTPAEKLAIAVEDAPFLAVTLEEEGGRLALVTNVGDRVALDGAAAWRTVDGVPYVEVRRGLEAKASRAVYHALAERLVECDGALGFVSAGRFFVLGPA